MVLEGLIMLVEISNRMIQFKDNENVSYRKVVKAKSIRK